MAASAAASVKAVERASAKDVGFAVGIVFILTVLFLPLPATFIDIGLSFSIALAVLILMVSLWIQRPLDFSAFPTVLLLATLLRLALNIATTRLILSNGSEGPEAAGHVIAGFANFVMSGDFVIGAIDGASKFVRGDAIAGIIITAVNVFGGIVIGVTRHGMSPADAATVFTTLSVGDGLVTQIPALIVSLAAGLLVSKGGTRGSAEKAILAQLGNYPRALLLAALVMFVLALAPGLPLLPFALLGSIMSFIAYAIPKHRAELRAAEEAKVQEAARVTEEEARNSVRESLKTVEIELCLGKQISASFIQTHSELAQRVAKMRRKFAKQYGFVVPEIRLSDDLSIPPKAYQIKIHGTMVASEELRIGDVLVITGDGPRPDMPCDEAREPAFGMKAVWVSEMFASEIKREGFKPIDNMSVLLTHMREVIRNNLAQMLSYKDVRMLLDRLDPEYRRLLEEITPSQISYSGIQAVLKLLLAERISIRNLHLVLEAIAEIAPHVRRAEQLVEHVRMRLAQQICGDLGEGGALKVLRLGNRWDLAFHQALKRDAKGDIAEFDIDPRLIEQFSTEASKAIRGHMDQGHQFVLVAAPDARPYVRMVTERLFATLPVLSHVEIARGVQIKSLGTIS